MIQIKTKPETVAKSATSSPGMKLPVFGALLGYRRPAGSIQISGNLVFVANRFLCQVLNSSLKLYKHANLNYRPKPAFSFNKVKVTQIRRAFCACLKTIFRSVERTPSSPNQLNTSKFQEPYICITRTEMCEVFSDHIVNQVKYQYTFVYSSQTN